ncbi:MAG: hypothetical protein DDT30_00995 [Dehalococcoidia bacterium]|nr:hypothetical protein [Bacillota bacterium]MBT9142285.1 hypothetical protein [Bacillota bacterium]
MSVTESSDEIQNKINEIARHIVAEHRKGKIPLFVAGSGISRGLRNSADKSKTMQIPSMDVMIEKLHSLYETSDKGEMPEEDKEDLNRRFGICEQHSKQDSGRLERSIVAGIFGRFQEKKYLKAVWGEFNKWLLHKCVNENPDIGIINACPSTAHKKIAELYEKVNAFYLTINFDGLFYKALESKYGKCGKNQVFSYYTREDAERFFTAENVRKNRENYYAEIEVRGDIFFVMCDPEWCDIFGICNDRSTTATRIWESKDKDPLMCEKGRDRKSFISFPGAYEKDQEVRQVLGVLWQYLAHQVSCLITIGIGGRWDPILIAFLSDLSRERKIPFIDVNPYPKSSCMGEIVTSDFPLNSLLKIDADRFMDTLSQFMDKHMGDMERRPRLQITYSSMGDGDDEFWTEILKDRKISDFEKDLMRHPLVEITYKFAQLGLESKWWGIENEGRQLHNRLNHSKGVMKIATFMYGMACDNSGRPQREEEKQFLRIAALLHDIGHLPFSHSTEGIFQELNWKPAGYIESFSHDYYTEEKVKKIFEDTNTNLGKQLGDIGYTVDDLIRLIRGEFGIGFLDAIINGPIDADKIDYVFRDAASIDFGLRINLEEFLEDMGEELSISPMGLLVLKGRSAEAAFTILEQRERLYKDFYLSPALGLLEKAMRFIVTTYFVYSYNTVKLFTDGNQRLLQDQTQFSDLGAIKIAKASEELEKLAVKFQHEDDIEMAIVEYMKNSLDEKTIDKRVKMAIGKCFSLVKQEGLNQKNQKEAYRTWCRQEESKRRQQLSSSEFSRERMKKIRQDAKTVTLRFPGAILIDFVPPFEFFKIAEARRRKARSDGTNVSSECILSRDLGRMVANHKSGKHEQGQVRVYKLGEESEVKAALALFEGLLREEGRLVGEE